MNKSINASEYCLNVFIDFSKAFDSITHEILISKLSSFGISEATINWFRSYLSNQQQRVILNNHLSDSLPVLYGVPQGSVLGPTLFIMYVNDIFNILFNSSLKLYADDAVLTLSHKDPHFLLSLMSNDLDLFTKWVKTNKLTINETKTNCMFSSSKFMLEKLANYCLPPLQINEICVHSVKSYTYLGLPMDYSLTFDLAVKTVVKKVHNKVHTLSLVRKYITQACAVTIMKSKVLPYIDYTLFALGAASDKNLTQLQRLQNRGLRICLQVHSHC